MASVSPQHILKVKSNLDHGFIDGLTNKQAWDTIYRLRNMGRLNDAINDDDYIQDTKPIAQVLFTGFSVDHRNSLETIARENQLKVVKSFTKGLKLLVCGENPGQAKITKANNLNVKIVDESGFLSMVAAGEFGQLRQQGDDSGHNNRQEITKFEINYFYLLIDVLLPGAGSFFAGGNGWLSLLLMGGAGQYLNKGEPDYIMYIAMMVVCMVWNVLVQHMKFNDKIK